MRLCDLNDLKMRVERQYENCHGYSGNKKAIYREAILAVRSILHSAKTIDAVPVVRCGKCKHFRPYEGEEHKGDCAELVGLESCVYEDDFCSYGERKEGAT